MVTHYIHPILSGLTGNAYQIAEIAQPYHARFEFMGEGEWENYTIDHTASLYAIDRDGKLMTVLPHGLPAQALAESLLHALDLLAE